MWSGDCHGKSCGHVMSTCSGRIGFRLPSNGGNWFIRGGNSTLGISAMLFPIETKGRELNDIAPAVKVGLH